MLNKLVKSLVAAAFLFCSSVEASAQTASQVLPGYMATHGCPGSLSSCYVNYPSMNTYVAIVNGYIPPATPTDMYGICGANNRIVIPLILNAYIQSTAAAIQTLYVIKRSAPDTGSTPVTPTIVAYDSTSPLPAASPVYFTTTNPSLGTSVGTIGYLVSNDSTTITAPTLFTPLTANLNGWSQINFNSPGILRSANECIYINYNGATLTSGWISTLFFEWIEI